MSTSIDQLNSDIQDLIEEFDFLGDWEERYRYLIDLGKDLAPLADHEKNEASKVHGCTSQVWLVYTLHDGVLNVRGDSDAHIVKGLVALLIRLYDQRPIEAARAVDAQSVLNAIGLAEHLSPQRSNGLASMVARLKAAVAA
ncbi:SufE family protein [Woodsholea maritima]|uniref:SufE family protein n=1 Tax=Woodsholea maritima TaxID=240237 RepID=UPI000370E969|nr:SufE family protein [Woodsholea maritima]